MKEHFSNKHNLGAFSIKYFVAVHLRMSDKNEKNEKPVDVHPVELRGAMVDIFLNKPDTTFASSMADSIVNEDRGGSGDNIMLEQQRFMLHGSQEIIEERPMHGSQEIIAERGS